MNQKALISVVIPVYKVEAYLDKCISSVVGQTYENLEIILVDDGSPDGSGMICDAWAAEDQRIRVIHQENAGGGAARNAALDVARGELIAFVDSDDYVSCDVYEHLYSLLDQGADIAECAHIDVMDDNETFSYCSSEVCTYTVHEAMEEHIRDRAFRQLIWNKLYRREVIGGIRFPVGKKIDDEFFTYQVIGNAKKLVRSDKICYAYRQQQDSVMHSMGVDKRLQAVEAKLARHAYIERYFPHLVGISLKDLWFTCLYQGQLALRGMEKADAEKAIASLKGTLSMYPCPSQDCTTKDRLWLTMAKVSLKGTCRLRNSMKVGL